MKSLLIIQILLIYSLTILAQNIENNTVRGNSADTKDTALVKLINPATEPEKTQSNDTTRIKLGKKGITIIERNGKTTVDITDIGDTTIKKKEEIESWDKVEKDQNNWLENESNKWKKKQRFHFAGLELGLNNYVDKKYNLSRSGNDSYMDINTGISMVCNLNIIEYPIKVTQNSAFVTGLGFNFNNYRFDGDSINIQKDNQGDIVKKSLNERVEKSKFKMTYITIPLLYEIQFPMGEKGKPLYISAGIIGGIKIGSTAKVVKNNGSTDIREDDLNLSPFRYGIQLRAGYRGLNLFATYNPVPLFEKGKGPELYPVELGLMLLNF